MAVDITYSMTTGTSSGTWPVVFTGSGGSTASYIYAGGGAGGYTSSAPRPQTALEWLDAETEAMCKLARLAG
jgi:hypothetical protein